MPEAERIEQHQNSRLLHSDFTQQAPVEQGVEVLMDWLNENLSRAIRREMDERKSYLPPLDTLGPILKQSIEGWYDEKTTTTARLLWHYVDYDYQIHLAKTSAPVNPNVPPDLKDKLHIPLEALIERKKGLYRALVDLGLTGEATLLHELFVQASALSPGPAQP